MKPQDVRVGHFYLRKGGGFVREIQSELPSGDISWRDYGDRDGNPIGTGVCSKYTLANWAERELAPSEISKMQREQAEELQTTREKALIKAAFAEASTEDLLSELHRRGIIANLIT